VEVEMTVPEQHAASDEEARKAVFAALVAVQDDGIPVGHSRTVVAERFGLGVEVVRDIEREGLNNEWPPL
jgi:hypothetical protein